MLLFVPRIWFFGGRWDSDQPRSARRRTPVTPAAPVVQDDTHDDVVLATRLRDGDVQALETLTKTYAAALEAHAYAVVRRDDVAQDVVQDVFIRLWDHRTTLELRGGWNAYLHRAVHFAAVSALRHEVTERRAGGTYVAAAGDVTTHPGTRALERAELDRALRAEVDALPPRCREIFLLSREGGLSYARIADVLHVAPQTVANQMHRALHRLADVVRRWERGE